VLGLWEEQKGNMSKKEDCAIMTFIKTGKYIGMVTILCMQVQLMDSTAPIKTWNSLLKSNEKFAKDHTFAKQRAQLKDKQNPPVIVLCCSDSRVSPELIFNEKLGSLFVVRIAGGVVDDLVIDSIEFAVANFDVEVIVVLGHSDCAAVAGALGHLQKNGGVTDKPRGHFGAVLIPIEKAIIEAGINIHGPQALQDSIQVQVRSTANQLIAESETITNALGNGKLIIVGAQYFLHTGNVDQLFVMPKTQSIKK